MKIVGLRRDGVLFVTVGSGVAVMLKGDRVTPPLDALTVDRLGPWDLVETTLPYWLRREAQAALDLARVAPMTHFALDKDEHGYGSDPKDERGGGDAPKKEGLFGKIKSALGFKKKEPEKPSKPELSPEEKAERAALRAKQEKRYAEEQAAAAERQKAKDAIEAAKPQEQREAEADDESSADLYKSIRSTAHSQASRMQRVKHRPQRAQEIRDHAEAKIAAHKAEYAERVKKLSPEAQKHVAAVAAKRAQRDAETAAYMKEHRLADAVPGMVALADDEEEVMPKMPVSEVAQATKEADAEAPAKKATVINLPPAIKVPGEAPIKAVAEKVVEEKAEKKVEEKAEEKVAEKVAEKASPDAVPGAAANPFFPAEERKQKRGALKEKIRGSVKSQKKVADVLEDEDISDDDLYAMAKALGVTLDETPTVVQLVDNTTKFQRLLASTTIAKTLTLNDKSEHPFQWCKDNVIPAMEREDKAPDDPDAFCAFWKKEHA